MGLLVHLVQALWGRPWGLQVCDVGHVPRAEGCAASGHTCRLVCGGRVHMATQPWMLGMVVTFSLLVCESGTLLMLRAGQHDDMCAIAGV